MTMDDSYALNTSIVRESLLFSVMNLSPIGVRVVCSIFKQRWAEKLG